MKIKYLIAYVSLCILGFHSLQAQHQSDYWYFGEQAGIDFTSGTAVARTDGALNTYEGCATISNSSGNLLFYTDGIKVWDANHSQMPNGNGLMGDLSSTQSAIIVPKPGSSNLYYIFTTDNGGGSNGLRYSIVNMALQSGLGDVTIKNQLLSTPVTEKLTAVQHINNQDVWVISHAFNSNNFLAYHVSAAGIDTNAVISSVGSSQGSMDFQGCLMTSPNGDKLADVVSIMSNKIELFDFNNSNGVVSNPLLISGYNKPYGIAFSPNGSRLYVTTRQPYRIYQFNLLAGSPTAIINSATQIASGAAAGYTMQLGPDYKIYVAKQNQTFLSRINDPNALGTACNYQNNAVDLLGRKCKLGLPAFIQSYYQPDILFSGLCPNQATSFQLSDTSVLDSVSWNFGDPGSGGNNTSTYIAPMHTFSSPGTYVVTALVYYNANMKTLTQQLTILSPPAINLGSDTSVCAGTNYTLNAGNQGISYLWSTGDTTIELHPNVSGLYWVQLTDMNGCTGVDSVQLTILPRPDVKVGTDKYICKNDSVQLQATGASTYYWTPVQSVSDPNIADPFAKPAYATEYIVVGTDSNGCQGSDSVIVYLKLQPNLVYNQDTIICSGDQAQLYAPAAFSYSWSPAANLSCDTCQFPIAHPMVTTVYSISVYNQQGCSRKAIFEVEVAARPAVDAGQDTSICKGDIIQLNAQSVDSSSIISMQWSPSIGLSSTTISNPAANPPQSTTYFFTSTNIFGCSTTDSIQILRDNINIDAGQDVQICPGSSIELKALSNQSGAYSWSPVQYAITPNQANTIVNPSLTQQFSVTITNAEGCHATDSVKVYILNIQAVDAGNSVSVCAGESIQLHASGASQFKWDPNIALSCSNCSDPIASPLSSMYFYVTGTGVQGCESRDSVWVSVKPNPLLQMSNDTVICPGSQVQLHANGASQYHWIPSSGLNCSFCPNPITSPNTSSSYSVVATGLNGCQSIDSVEISVYPIPKLNFTGNTSLCEGEQTQITVQGAQNYVWTPSSLISCTSCANPLLSPIVPTWFQVQASSIDGCFIEDSIFIDVHPIPNMLVTNDTSVCLGSGIQLSASGAADYQWQPTTSLSCSTCPDPMAFPASLTVYQVIGSNQYGCSSIKSIQVNVNPLPVVSVSPDDTVCLGNNIMVQAGGAISYTWEPINAVVTTSMQSAVLHPTITTIFTVTGVDLNGCLNTNTVNIFVHNGSNITVSPDISICYGDSTKLSVSGGSNYTWTPAAGLNCTQCSGPKASPASSVVYTVQSNDPFGCPGTGTVKVTVNPLPAIWISADQVICKGENTQLEASGGVKYSWKPKKNLNTPNLSKTLAYPTSTTLYTLTVTSMNGCKDSANTLLEVHDAPVVYIQQDTDICLGTSIKLHANGGDFYSWSPLISLNNSSIASPLATPLTTTEYTVTISDSAGCSNDTTVKISVVIPANPKISNDTAICEDGMAQLSAHNGVEYRWTPVSGLDCPSCSQPSANPSLSTNYQIEITDINGCKSYDSVWVYILPPPQLDAGEDIYLKSGSSIYLNASGADEYYWTPGYWLDNPTVSNPLATPLDTITYTVIGTNENGCSASDELTIFLFKDAEITIPNAFSPNQDGLNDIFNIEYSYGFILDNFMIFNRWGEMVFYTQDSSIGWDGTFSGYAQPIGSYIYILTGHSSSGEAIQKTGNITLIK